MVIFVKFIRPRKELDIADIQIVKYPPIYQARNFFQRGVLYRKCFLSELSTLIAHT